MGENSLRRYTSLVAAIQMLRKGVITFLSPLTWDDKNDAHTLTLYRDAIGAGRILALCLAEHFETYHHWKIYAPGHEGVCIEFDKEGLLAAFDGKPGFQHGYVRYRTIDEMRNQRIEIPDLPFIKRYPFNGEQEYRIIYADNNEGKAEEFRMNLGCIRRINLSPWMPESLTGSIRETIRGISGCEDVPINHSKLVDYKQWKSAVDRACNGQFNK